MLLLPEVVTVTDVGSDAPATRQNTYAPWLLTFDAPVDRVYPAGVDTVVSELMPSTSRSPGLGAPAG